MDKLFRSLPAFKGKERLARLFLASAIKNKKDITVAGKYGCTYMLPNIMENVGFDIFINGEYEHEIQELICRLLPDQGCFLDLGANIGSIVIPVAKRKPGIKAVAVEAAPWIFRYLQDNITRNRVNNVHLINNALFDEDDIELDFFSPHDKYGKGSLAPVFTQESVKVKTRKVDTFIRELQLGKVDVVKIDVEGFEHFVFRGAEKLLRATDAPALVFEFVDWAEKRAMGLMPGAAQQLLKDMGYTLYEIRGKKLKKLEDCLQTGAANLLASKQALSFYQEG